MLKSFKLYLVINLNQQNRYPPDKLAEEAIRAGVDVVQLRYKGDNLRLLWHWGEKIMPLAKAAGVSLIINDRVDVVLALDAAGVHLGQHDMPIAAARKLLGQDKLIGISCHNIEEALAAQGQTADYVSMGPIFPTMSKADAKAPLGFKLIKQFNRQLTIPWVAIGGINTTNLAALVAAGVSRIAVISAIAQAENIALAVRQLKEILSP
jgi:thiamine-phosphate pyrophosphorylase